MVHIGQHERSPIIYKVAQISQPAFKGVHIFIFPLSVANKHKCKCRLIWLKKTFSTIHCLQCFTFICCISPFSFNVDRQVQWHFQSWIASVNWKKVLQSRLFSRSSIYRLCYEDKAREHGFLWTASLQNLHTVSKCCFFNFLKFSPSSTIFLPVFLPFLTFFPRFFFLPVNSCTPSLLFPSVPASLPPQSSNPHSSPIRVNVNRSFLNLSKQEVLPDRKRVTTRSYLPISPVDTDSGRNFTCVASNPAVPMGKRATVTLNIHRTSSFTPFLLYFCV